MRLFDLHCDTAYEMYKRNCGLFENSLHIGLDRASKIDEYIQLMAVWCDKERSDEECYEDFYKIADHLEKIEKKSSKKFRYILTVEDARLLCGKIERLDELAKRGVRVLTPLWEGETIIGGAFNTSTRLSDFGKKVVLRCTELGIVPDISHASAESADDIFHIAESAGKPIIASHSCSFAVYPHPRNLRDTQFEKVKASGGIVGLSFCRYHLTKSDVCPPEIILEHIAHFLELGGENFICLGADMDGAPMPDGIDGIEYIPILYTKLCERFGKVIADKITWENASSFFERNKII